MTPHQLDLLVNGAFVYERQDGTTFHSLDYKLRDYGVKCVGRVPLDQAEIERRSA